MELTSFIIGCLCGVVGSWAAMAIIIYIDPRRRESFGPVAQWTRAGAF